MSILKVKNLKKYFKNIKAVDGISFETHENTIHALLGPNGAGKTTTMKCILGIVKPTSGFVEIFGVKNDPQRVLKRLSFVPEEKNLYDSFTALNMVEYMKDIVENFNPKKAFELLEYFQIPLKEKIITFSHGMKTQLYLALSFAQDADLFILDEPTWGLDPLVRNKVLEMMREIGVEKTILYSSHILSEVEKISDRVTIMVKGKVVFDGYLDDARKNFKYVIVPMDVEIPDDMIVSISKMKDQKILVVGDERKLDEILRITKGKAKVENMNLDDIFTIIVEKNQNSRR